MKLFEQKGFFIKSKIALLVDFLEDIGERADEEEARRELEEGFENLGHHRSIRDRSNPLEDLTERQTRYYTIGKLYTPHVHCLFGLRVKNSRN